VVRARRARLSGSSWTGKKFNMLLQVQEVADAFAPGAKLPENGEHAVLDSLAPLVGRTAARKLVAAVGKHGLARQDGAELMVAAGVSRKTADKVVAARTLVEVLARPRVRIPEARHVTFELPLGYARYEREVMIALLLNGQHERLATVLIAAGGMSMVAITAVDVLRPVLRFGCVGYILCHNHPSSDPTPSRADIAFTNRIARASRLVGIRLLDHVIIAERGMSSMHELGLMPTDEELDLMEEPS